MSPESRRAKQAVIAQRLRIEGGGGEGLTIAAIAREMGISVSYAGELLADPTGERARARKRKYLKRCKTCGELCHGEHCIAHMPAKGKKPVWTKEMVIEAIQEWEIMHGRPPTITEWRHRDGLPAWCPTFKVAYKLFGKGGWNKAIEAAGFTPRPARPPEYTFGQNRGNRMSPEAREAMSVERKRLYAENPDDPRWSGLHEGHRLTKQGGPAGSRARSARIARRFR